MERGIQIREQTLGGLQPGGWYARVIVPRGKLESQPLMDTTARGLYPEMRSVLENS